MRKIKVNYVRWERSDAIGKATSMCLNYLKDKVDLNIILLKIRSKNKIMQCFQLFENIIKLSKLLFKDEIIHFEEPKKLELNSILLFRPKKLILMTHHLEENNGSLIKKLYSFNQKWIHKAFFKIIAISEQTRLDLINEYEINPDKIKMVYLGVDKTIFKPTNKKLKNIHNKYILYLGSEIPRKNIENLLKAFKIISAKYPRLVLLKAGYSGGNKYRDNTKKLIQKCNLANKVIFTEYIKEKDLSIYYSNAELFLYPSLKEGFGMPLVEAMACGCPVVTSDISPMKEIAKGQELTNPYSSEDIANGIDKILSNKKYRETLKKNAIKQAKNFDWHKSAMQIFEIYKELENLNPQNPQPQTPKLKLKSLNPRASLNNKIIND